MGTNYETLLLTLRHNLNKKLRRKTFTKISKFLRVFEQNSEKCIFDRNIKKNVFPKTVVKKNRLRRNNQ